jgi:hypothetical protein
VCYSDLVGAVKKNGEGVVGGVKAQILGGFAVPVGMGLAVYTLGNRDVVAPPFCGEGVSFGGDKDNAGAEAVFP